MGQVQSTSCFTTNASLYSEPTEVETSGVITHPSKTCITRTLDAIISSNTLTIPQKQEIAKFRRKITEIKGEYQEAFLEFFTSHRAITAIVTTISFTLPIQALPDLSVFKLSVLKLNQDPMAGVNLLSLRKINTITLSSLDLSKCGTIRDLSQIPVCPQAKTLVLSGCENLVTIARIRRKFRHLANLNVKGTGLIDVYDAKELNIKKLTIGGDRLESLRYVSDLSNLEELHLLDAKKIHILGGLESCKRLRKLHLKMPHLDNAAHLRLCKLEELTLEDTLKRHVYTDLPSLPLKRLWVEAGENRLKDHHIEFIQQHRLLTDLKIQGRWISTQTLGSLNCFSELKRLEMHVVLGETNRNIHFVAENTTDINNFFSKYGDECSKASLQSIDSGWRSSVEQIDSATNYE